MNTLNCNGRLLDMSRPVVMGILNTTPDSFFDGGRYAQESDWLQQAEKMLTEGATLIDIGGVSTRPGAEVVTEAEELSRVLPAIESLTRRFPEALLSVDTTQGKVAKMAVQAGAHLVNDVSAGQLDPDLFPLLAEMKVPYCLMHMQGTPQNMQQDPHYDDVVAEVLQFFVSKISQLRALGLKDIILDPGFGFGKTVAHNYTLLRHLDTFSNVLGVPILVGVSRKSMICKPLGVSATNALNGTSVLHTIALQKGANILRAHDVREAMQVIQLWEMLESKDLPFPSE